MNVLQEMAPKPASRWQQVLLASRSWKAHDRFYVRSVEAAQEKKFRSTSSSYFNYIPFTKELERSLREFSQPLLIHTSNISVNYLVFGIFFERRGKMVNRSSRHAFVEKVTTIQGLPKQPPFVPDRQKCPANNCYPVPVPYSNTVTDFFKFCY